MNAGGSKVNLPLNQDFIRSGTRAVKQRQDKERDRGTRSGGRKMNRRCSLSPHLTNGHKFAEQMAAGHVAKRTVYCFADVK